MGRTDDGGHHAVIRALTDGERALADEMFGDALALEHVRLFAAPWPVFLAFVPGRWFGRDWIVWPRNSCAGDFSKADIWHQSVLIHELVHIWQAQSGVNLGIAKLKAGFKSAAYAYPAEPCGWAGLNIEQQAMVMQHRFLRTRGRTAPADHAVFDPCAPFGRGRILDPHS